MGQENSPGWFLLLCRWHPPPQRQTSLHWCSCTGWLSHILLLFLGNPCYRIYLWDEPASKSTRRWKETLSTLQWVRSQAGKTEEGPMPGKCSLDITKVVWHSFGSRICASSWLYHHRTEYCFCLFGRLPVILGFWHPWTCVEMWSKFSKLRISIIIWISFSCSRPRLIPNSFQYLTEMFRLGEQSPSSPLTLVGTSAKGSSGPGWDDQALFLHLAQRVFRVISYPSLVCLLMA